MNPEAERLLMHTRDRLLGRNMCAVFPDLIDTIYSQKYHQAVRERQPLQFEAYYEPYVL